MLCDSNDLIRGGTEIKEKLYKLFEFDRQTIGFLFFLSHYCLTGTFCSRIVEISI